MKALLILITFQFFLLLNLPSNAQIEPQWFSYYNDTVNGNSQANAITIDKNGNIYVTGMSDRDLYYTPITTIMYLSSNGGQNWITRYPNDGTGNESAGNSIATYTNNSGNTFIYVTGRTNNYQKIVTVKFNENGSMIWANTYYGNLNGFNTAYHIETDGEGSAFVTGTVFNGNNGDFVTIKYNSSGTQQWVKTYNGTGNGDDVSQSLKVIGGYVYITGTSIGNGTGFDIVTIAYEAGDLDSVWGSIYNNGSSDKSYDIDADTYKGAYVTGSSGSNFVVIKYDNTDGTQEWVKNNQAGEGYSIGLFRNPCTGNTPCYTIDLFITGVNGSNGKTIGYDEDGNLLSGWPQSYSSGQFLSLAVDLDENVYVTGNSGYNYLTVMYDKSGSQQWYGIFPDTNELSTATGIVVDEDDNAFVTGYHLTGQPYLTSGLYLTLKYSTNNGGDQIVSNSPNGKENKTNPRIPSDYALEQNYPNPFNSSALIEYALPKDAYVVLKVYNLLGMEVALIVNEFKTAGSHSVSFDGSNLASGMYFYRLTASSFAETKKMLLVK